jgi:hypothetical protein
VLKLRFGLQPEWRSSILARAFSGMGLTHLPVFDHWQSNLIKLVAFFSMLSDHTGVALFPNDLVWRIVGRIAFPLFAYQLGVGYNHTSDKRSFAFRLFLFALVSQLPYSLVRGEWVLNIFVTLLIGLGAIHLYATKRTGLVGPYLLASLAISYFVPFDGGGYGVLMIFLLYALPTFAGQIAAVAGLNFLFLISSEDFLYNFSSFGYVQMFSLLSIPLLWEIKYLHLPGWVKGNLSHVNKWIFYILYPLHLSALWTLKIILA